VPGVAAGAAVPSGAQAQAQAPKASKPRTDSYDDPVAFNGPSAYRRFLQKEGIPVYEGGAIDVNKVELKPWKRVGALGAYIFPGRHRGDGRRLGRRDPAGRPDQSGAAHLRGADPGPRRKGAHPGLAG